MTVNELELLKRIEALEKSHLELLEDFNELFMVRKNNEVLKQKIINLQKINSKKHIK